MGFRAEGRWGNYGILCKAGPSVNQGFSAVHQPAPLGSLWAILSTEFLWEPTLSAPRESLCYWE